MSRVPQLQPIDPGPDASRHALNVAAFLNASLLFEGRLARVEALRHALIEAWDDLQRAERLLDEAGRLARKNRQGEAEQKRREGLEG